MSVELVNDELKITVKDTEYSLSLIGSTLTSWKVNGNELIFNSENSKLDGKSEYFGGIPLVFPQFALAKEPNPAHKLPIHGVIRLLSFVYLEEETQTSEDKVVVSLGINSALFRLQNPKLHELYPYKFSYTSTYTFSAESLKIGVKVDNSDYEDLWVTPLFHNYFKVKSIHQIKLQGLEGIEYWDKNDKDQTEPKLNETKELSITKGIDNIYLNSIISPDNVITLVEESYKLELSATGLKDTVVWNPWTLGGSYGLKDDDYENFLCVELGQVMDPYKIKKEQSWEYSQSIKFVPN